MNTDLSLKEEKRHVYATYNKQFDLVTVNLRNINSSFKEKLKLNISDCKDSELSFSEYESTLTSLVSDALKHELVHREVWRVIRKDKIKLGQFHKTKEEWIARTMCGDELNPFTLVNPAFDDGMVSAMKTFKLEVFDTVSKKYIKWLNLALIINILFAVMNALRLIWK